MVFRAPISRKICSGHWGPRRLDCASKYAGHICLTAFSPMISVPTLMSCAAVRFGRMCCLTCFATSRSIEALWFAAFSNSVTAFSQEPLLALYITSRNRLFASTSRAVPLAFLICFIAVVHASLHHGVPPPVRGFLCFLVNLPYGESDLHSTPSMMAPKSAVASVSTRCRCSSGSGVAITCLYHACHAARGSSISFVYLRQSGELVSVHLMGSWGRARPGMVVLTVTMLYVQEHTHT